MNNQEIIDNAPDGENSDVVDITGAYFDEHCNHLNLEGFWSESDIAPVSPRSLADIKRIIELEKALEHAVQEKWINCRASLPEYGDPVTVKAHGVVQHVTYTLSGAGEDFDVKLDWFEPYHFEHDDNCKIPLSNNVEWMPLPKDKTLKETKP
jgi:hypothetical protein